MIKVWIAVLSLAACAAVAAPPVDIVAAKDGPMMQKFTLANAKGAFLKVLDYGAIITELHVPDRAGRLADVVLGFDDIDSYTTKNPYFGCVAGRVGNRIAKGQFTLDGAAYKLAINNAPNHLHGGVKGFDKVIWRGRQSDRSAVELTYVSADGEEGYPGKLTTTVKYSLSDANELTIDYTATTTKPTPVNLTQHTYFNLAGHASGDVLGQVMHLDCDTYTATDATLIPTGELKPVIGTPFDFLPPTPIGKNIASAGNEPVGYDLNFCVRGYQAGKLNPCARVVEPKSGRVMEVFTTEPGVQLYTANHLNGTLKGKGGAMYKQYQGFCLECQHYPDSINRPEFPSVVLRPGEEYRQTTKYKFSVE